MVGLRVGFIPALAVLVLLYAGPVHACPGLEGSTTRVGGTVLAKDTHSLTLRFTGEIEAKGSKITVTDAAGHDYAVGAPVGFDKPLTSLRVKLRPLHPGIYKVRWHIPCHCDGEKAMMPGGFSFVVRDKK